MPAHRSYLARHRTWAQFQSSPEDWTENELSQALDGAVDLREFASWLLQIVQREAQITLQPIARKYRRDLRDVIEDLVNDVMLDLFLEGGKALRAWKPHLGMRLPGFVALIARRTILRRFKNFRGNPWSSTPADAEKLHALLDEGIADRASIIEDIEYRIQLDGVLSTLHSELNDRDWRFFRKLFIEQRPPLDVGVEEQVTENAVHQWRSRFQARVRKLFRQPQMNSRASLAAAGDLAARFRSLRDPLFDDLKEHLKPFLPPLTVLRAEALIDRILEQINDKRRGSSAVLLRTSVSPES